MSPDLERLIELQRIESVLADARQQLGAGPERQAAADDRLAGAQRAVTDAAERLTDGQNTRLALEKEAAVFQGRLSKYRDQLSAVKTNREYQAMQTEMATAEAELQSVEDKVLECMVEADTLAVEVTSAETALAARQKEVAAEKRELDEALARTAALLLEVTAERGTLVGQIDRQLVTLFEKVARMRKGVAVCKTTDGLCSLCHVRLRPQVYQEVRSNSAVVQCDVCQRILYFAPPPATPPPDLPTTEA